MTRDKHPFLILASSSKARAQILKNIGVTFEVDPADIDEEKYLAETAAKLAETLALEKAKVVASRHPKSFVLAADTVIVEIRDGVEKIHGKPRDESHAKEILSALSGHTHQVITGLCLYVPAALGKKQFIVGSEITLVTFKKLTMNDISQYVRTGEPIGKSGAYGIQGLARAFIERIEGNEDNVIGMPISLLNKLLESGLDN